MNKNDVNASFVKRIAEEAKEGWVADVDFSFVGKGYRNITIGISYYPAESECDLEEQYHVGVNGANIAVFTILDSDDYEDFIKYVLDLVAVI